MSDESSQLATIGTEPSIAHMLSAMIERGITADNMNAFERMISLHERMEDRAAEKQFAAAFVALQGDMPAIQAVKAVPNNDGTIRYHYAPYESIMEQARPLLLKHGFSVTFSTDNKDGRVVQLCTLQHTGGHKRTNQFAARVGKGPPGSSDAQGDGAASTYAKRHALCNALNITIETDTDGVSQDARDIGAPITRDQVQYLREQIKETASNEATLLKFAGAPSIEEIGSAVYPVIIRMIEQKKAKK